MGSVMLQVLGLGVAGIDPLGAVLVFSAITAGAARAKVVALAVSVLVATVAAGVVLTLTGRSLAGNSTSAEPSEPGPVWAYIELAVAVVLVVWLWRGLSGKREVGPKAESKRRLKGPVLVFVGAGCLFSLTSVVDPTFLAAAAVLGPVDNMFFTFIAFGVWTLISQFMLFVLLVAFLVGADQRIVGASQRLWARHRDRFRVFLYVAGAVAVVVLAFDAGYFFINDRYIGG